MLSGTFCNLLSRLPDEHQLFDLAAKAFDPLVILRLLIIAASDQKGRPVHRADTLNRRIGICSLRIIVKLHTALFCHVLNPVLDRLKPL